MLTEQLLDSPSHFLRGFGVYCRDNGISESEALRGLQKAAATFPQVELELRKTALDPNSVKSSTGLVRGLAGKAWGGVKSVFGYGAGNAAKPLTKAAPPLTKAAPPLATGSRVPGGVLGGTAPSGPLNAAVPTLQTRLGTTQKTLVTPAVLPSNNTGTGTPHSRATTGAPRFTTAPTTATTPAPTTATTPAPTTATTPAPTTATTPAPTTATTPAPRDGLGQLRRPDPVSNEDYAAAYDAANTVKTRSWGQATKDGLGQARDIAIGGTAGQKALTAGSAAAGATYGGVSAAMDPDSDWGDVAGRAAQYGLAGAAVPLAIRGYDPGNVAKSLASASLAGSAGYVGAQLDDTIAGERGMYGTGDFDAVNTQAALDERGSRAHALLASRQSTDPAVNAANENELLKRQVAATARINGDPSNVDRTFADYAPKYTGRLDSPESLNEFLEVGGEAAKAKLRGNAANLERQLAMSEQSGKELDPKMLKEYVTVQEALASNANGGKPGDVAAKVAKELEHGITEEGVGNSLKTDAGKDAFKEYSKQFFGPDGPTADPSTILSNFVEIMKAKPYQAAALMLGIPVALFGVMSALGGEGGMGAVLATVLGGGAAAYGAGMFGGPEQGGGMKLFGAGPAGPAAAAAAQETPNVVNGKTNFDFAVSDPTAAYAAGRADAANGKNFQQLFPNQPAFEAAMAAAKDGKLLDWVAANRPDGWVARNRDIVSSLEKTMKAPQPQTVAATQ